MEGFPSALEFGDDRFGGGFPDKRSRFQRSAQLVIAALCSATLVNRPRRSALSVSSLNQRSTKFSRELEVGVNWRCQRARSRWSSHRVISGALWVDRLSKITWLSRSAGMAGVDLFEEPQHLAGGVPGLESDQDFSFRQTRRVAWDCTVSVDGVRSSVPYQHVDDRVWVRWAAAATLTVNICGVSTHRKAGRHERAEL